jgi:hypothetical protein
MLPMDSLKKISMTRAGWSNKPEQLFLTSKDITIDGGEPGKNYAIKFVVSFIPDSGKMERNLMSRVFSIKIPKK